MKGKIILLVVLGLVLVGLYSRKQEDSKMTHIIFWIEEMKMGSQQYQRFTQDLYLVGDRYMRIAHTSHADEVKYDLNIVALGDMYQIDSGDKTGQRRPNRDQTINVPILPVMFRKGFEELKFGDELKFFEEKNITPRAVTRGGDADPYQSYELKSGNATLTVLINETTGSPYEVSVKRGKDRLVILYDTYEKGLEPDMSLFEPPADVKMS